MVMLFILLSAQSITIQYLYKVLDQYIWKKYIFIKEHIYLLYLVDSVLSNKKSHWSYFWLLFLNFFSLLSLLLELQVLHQDLGLALGLHLWVKNHFFLFYLRLRRNFNEPSFSFKSFLIYSSYLRWSLVHMLHFLAFISFLNA